MTGVPRVNPEAITGALSDESQRQQTWQQRRDAGERADAEVIASRIITAANKGRLSADIKGGRLGIKRTEHSVGTYSKVAQLLGEQSMTFEVYRGLENGYVFVGIGFAQTSREWHKYRITEFDGQQVDPPGQFLDFLRVYPPLPPAQPRRLG